jgi:hypothetical protein
LVWHSYLPSRRWDPLSDVANPSKNALNCHFSIISKNGSSVIVPF